MAIAHVGGGLGDAVRVGGGGVGVVGRVVVVGRMLVAAASESRRQAAGGIPSGRAAHVGDAQVCIPSRRGNPLAVVQRLKVVDVPVNRKADAELPSIPAYPIEDCRFFCEVGSAA